MAKKKHCDKKQRKQKPSVNHGEVACADTVALLIEKVGEGLNIQRVLQRYKSDCGVACVAMVARVSYQQAFVAIGFAPGQTKFYTGHRQLTAALRRLGLTVHWKMFRSWAAISGIAIVAVNHRYQRMNFHWVVFDGVCILDPFPRKPTAATKPKRYHASGWYLLVSHPANVTRVSSHLSTASSTQPSS